MDRRTAVLAPTEAGIALIDRSVACAQRSHDAALAPLSLAEANPASGPAAQAGLSLTETLTLDAMSTAAPPPLGFGFASPISRTGTGWSGSTARSWNASPPGMPQACTPGCWTARAAPDALAKKAESELVVALGPHLDGFLAALFGIEAETLALARETAALDPIHACKRLFVQRQAVKKYPRSVRLRWRGPARGAGSARWASR